MLLPLRLLSRWTISACPGRLSPLRAPQLLRTCLPAWGPRTSCPQHPSPSWSYLHRVNAICHRPSEHHAGELRSSPDSLRGPRLRPLPSPLRGSTPISSLSQHQSVTSKAQLPPPLPRDDFEEPKSGGSQVASSNFNRTKAVCQGGGGPLLGHWDFQRSVIPDCANDGQTLFPWIIRRQ